MVIETMMIPLATAILKALKIVASLEKASREVKSKCRDLDERVQTLQGILRGYLSAAAENEGTAAALRGLEAALGVAARDVESCGGGGLVLSVVSDTNSKDLAKLKAAEEKIETCISDLRLAQAVIIQPQPVIVCHIHVGKLYLELPRGAAALEQPHMQMLLEELAPGVVPDVPSSPCRLIVLGNTVRYAVDNGPRDYH